jgi:transposase
MENTNHNDMHQHRHEGDAYRRIELITGTLRRRRWTAAEKSALVAESLQPGINVSALALVYAVAKMHVVPLKLPSPSWP